MCEKCRELDGRIEHYRQFARWVSDELTLEGIKILIEKLNQDKGLLHHSLID